MKNLVKERLISFRDNFYKYKRSKGIIAFMMESPLHLVILLEVAIADLEGEPNCFEDLIKYIPSRYGSRSTINTILNDYVAQDYFCKRTSKDDKREKVYSVCPGQLELIFGWINSRHLSLKEVG